MPEFLEGRSVDEGGKVQKFKGSKVQEFNPHPHIRSGFLKYIKIQDCHMGGFPLNY